MPLDVVEFDVTEIAGLPVRSPRRALGEVADSAVDRAWSAVLHQDTHGPLATLYTDFTPAIGSYNTQIVGYRVVDGVVAPGHIVGRAPAGRYARFSAVGSFPDLLLSVWRELARAEESGELVRAHTGEFEVYPHNYKIELFVPLAPGTPGSAAGGGR